MSTSCSTRTGGSGLPGQMVGPHSAAGGTDRAGQALHHSASGRQYATKEDGTPGRTRTFGLRIRNPQARPVSGCRDAACEPASSDPSRNPSTPVQEDTDLALVVEAWAGLPDAVKAGILAMVEASRDGAES